MNSNWSIYQQTNPCPAKYVTTAVLTSKTCSCTQWGAIKSEFIYCWKISYHWNKSVECCSPHNLWICAFHKFYCLVDELMKTMKLKTHFPRILWTTKFHIIHTNQTLLWNLLFNQVVDGLPLKGMSSTFMILKSDLQEMKKKIFRIYVFAK